MNGLARFQADVALQLANARIHELQREAANHATATASARRRGSTLRSALSSVTGWFTTPVATDSWTLPRLSDYPYRS